MDAFTRTADAWFAIARGILAAFAPKSANAGGGLECPECLNNDGDYIEKIHARERAPC